MANPETKANPTTKVPQDQAMGEVKAWGAAGGGEVADANVPGGLESGTSILPENMGEASRERSECQEVSIICV